MRLLLLSAVLFSLVQAPPRTAAPFSELEQARLDAIFQESRALDAEQRTLDLLRERWRVKVQTFKAAVERERPGWTWEPETGKWSEAK